MREQGSLPETPEEYGTEYRIIPAYPLSLPASTIAVVNGEEEKLSSGSFLSLAMFVLLSGERQWGGGVKVGCCLETAYLCE